MESGTVQDQEHLDVEVHLSHGLFSVLWVHLNLESICNEVETRGRKGLNALIRCAGCPNVTTFGVEIVGTQTSLQVHIGL